MAEWLYGDTEMARRIRARDWDGTALGPRAAWPAALRRAVQLIIDFTPWAWVGWGEGLNVVYNDACVRFVGSKHPDRLGRPLIEVFPSLYKTDADELAKVLGGTTRTFLDRRVQVTNLPGQPHGWFSYTWVPLRDDDGVVRGIFAAGLDTTRRVLAEQSVLTTTRRLEFALAASRTASWESDLNTGQVTRIGAHDAMFGYDQPPPTWNRDMFLEHVLPEDQPEVLRIYNIDPVDRPTWSFECRIRRADGVVRWLRVDGEVRYDQNGKPATRAGVIQDITEHRTLIEELREANQAAQSASQTKSVFLAPMSHEMRTPLNIIKGMAHLLRRTGLDAQQSGYLDNLESAGTHLLGVIDDVLDLSRIEAGRIDLAEAPLNLGALLAQILEQAEALAAGRIALRLDTAVPDLALVGDAQRLRQALMNYLSNALKFTERGQIVVRVRTVDETAAGLMLRFEVEDPGIGIDPADLARLFTPFEQADAGATRKYGGTGLGLAITRRLAEAMGGAAGASSEPGRGSCFWFTARLPRHHAPIATPEGIDQATLEARLRASGPWRILVAEDEPLSRELALMLLADVGITADAVRSGDEAVAAAADQAYDLILMDLQMPGLDGIGAARAIAAGQHGAIVPIIALTANTFASDRAAARAAGMVDFLSKPVEPEQLYATLVQHPIDHGSTRRH